jgi:hypothetical protein
MVAVEVGVAGDAVAPQAESITDSIRHRMRADFEGLVFIFFSLENWMFMLLFFQQRAANPR